MAGYIFHVSRSNTILATHRLEVRLVLLATPNASTKSHNSSTFWFRQSDLNLKVNYYALESNSLSGLGFAVLVLKDSELWRVELALIDQDLFSAMINQYKEQADFHFHIHEASIDTIYKEVCKIKENLNDNKVSGLSAAMKHLERDVRSRMSCALSSYLDKLHYTSGGELY